MGLKKTQSTKQKYLQKRKGNELKKKKLNAGLKWESHGLSTHVKSLWNKSDTKTYGENIKWETTCFTS